MRETWGRIQIDLDLNPERCLNVKSDPGPDRYQTDADPQHCFMKNGQAPGDAFSALRTALQSMKVLHCFFLS